MSWQWEDFTARDFADAVEKTKGVCILPIGVIEKHGEHMPLGTDVFAAQEVARRAAEIEPAVVFPFYFFGQIHCAKHCPGTIAVRMRIALEMLENICDEIARNGLKKIILLNGHGGNVAMLPHFARTMLEDQRDYVLHVVGIGSYFLDVLNSPEWKAMRASDFESHAGEAETSKVLAAKPGLVKMEDVAAPETGQPLGRLSHVPGTFTGIFWYADHPTHYAGDAREATAEKGEFLLDACARKVAEAIKAVKDDSVARELQDEFFSRIQH